MNIYQRAKKGTCELEATCTSISQPKWDELMKGAKRANRKEVVKIAMRAGAIDEDLGRMELKNPYFNPYNHYKTDTHIIYVNSAIEHFIRVY